jgi:fermentation-respiration switch protein FrsA (DUF1100 family)
MRRYVFLLIYVLLSGCATSFDRKEPYPGLKVISTENTTGYEFRNLSSKKLLIVLEGSGWSSVLGVKKNNWKYVGVTAWLLQDLKSEYTIFVPEKFKREPGRDYFNDFEERERYTFMNLLACYTESINSYIVNNTFDSIGIIGISEGAIILPVLYTKINNAKVNFLVAYAGGGLSLRESYEIFAASSRRLSGYRKALFAAIVETYKTTPYPDSLDAGFSAFPFRWWSSFIDVRPFDYYKNINIPVLFVHGEKDQNVPVESSRYVEHNLPQKPFSYIYYPYLKHTPATYKQKTVFRKDIAAWITTHNK